MKNRPTLIPFRDKTFTKVLQGIMILFMSVFMVNIIVVIETDFQQPTIQIVDFTESSEQGPEEEREVSDDTQEFESLLFCQFGYPGIGNTIHNIGHSQSFSFKDLCYEILTPPPELIVLG